MELLWISTKRTHANFIVCVFDICVSVVISFAYALSIHATFCHFCCLKNLHLAFESMEHSQHIYCIPKCNPIQIARHHQSFYQEIFRRQINSIATTSFISCHTLHSISIHRCCCRSADRIFQWTDVVVRWRITSTIYLNVLHSIIIGFDCTLVSSNRNHFGVLEVFHKSHAEN